MAIFLPDANTLIHALRKQAPDHAACRQWLVDTAGNRHTIGLAELVEVALLRIPTLPKLRLVPMEETLGFWQEDIWTCGNVFRLTAGARHNEILAGFIKKLNLHGNDVNDAWLAALAVEHEATLVSTDDGFDRFPALNWLDPRIRN